MRPRMTSRLPSHRPTSEPSPRKNDMLGKKNPWSVSSFFFLIIQPPPRSTLFPYTTLFRSLRCFQKVDGSLHVVSKNLTRIGRPEAIVARNVKDVSVILYRRINRIPTPQIALHPIDQIGRAHV